jgi:hypothetical protein
MPRDVVKQRELARTSDQSERQARGGFRVFAQVSGLGCIDLGTEGREFKSRQPDKQIPSLNRRFAVSEVSRRTAGVRSGREQAGRRWKWRSGTARPTLL